MYRYPFPTIIQCIENIEELECLLANRGAKEDRRSHGAKFSRPVLSIPASVQKRDINLREAALEESTAFDRKKAKNSVSIQESASKEIN